MVKSVLVVGLGAREHAIIDRLSKSTSVSKIFIFSQDCNAILYNNFKIKCINDFHIDNDSFFEKTINYIKQHNIDFVFIGPEKYLAEGIIDILDKNNIPNFGPTKNASRIETSKLYSKDLMVKLEIPTANYKYFNNSKEALEYISDINVNNYVIKADGLASGKGVFLPKTNKEAKENIIDIMEHKIFGLSGSLIIVEEKLYGKEVSVFGFCNGYEVYLMPCVQDYKLSRDNNNGFNTGGMGSHGPVYTLTDEELKLCKKYMENVVKHLNYKGVLYMGLMKTDNGLSVLEFNCRFGDPETQVLMNLLDTDLYEICYNCYKNQKPTIKWNNKFVSNVILTHLDYPQHKLKTPTQIFGLDKLDSTVKIYYSNVNVNNENKYYTTGGRILSVVSISNNYYKSLNNIYNNINKFELEDGKRYYRMDIGYEYLLENKNLLNSFYPNKQHNLQKYSERKIKIAILGSTNGTSMEYLINSIKNNEIQNASIEVIISNNNSGILEKAKEHKISSIYLPSKNISKEKYDTKLCNILKLYEIDYVFLIGYMRIVSPIIIDIFKNRIFNIHPSLIPRYSGKMNNDIHTEVLKNNEYISGCTLHIVTEEVDKGRIIIQKQLLLDNNYDNVLLKYEIQLLEKQCILDCVKMILNNTINSKTTYSDSGVNIEDGDKFVDIIKELKYEIQDNRIENNDKNIGNFCSLTKIPNSDLLLATSTDGVGTKIELQNKYNCLEMAGQDLVAMCVNDLICHGAMPYYFLDYIASEKLDLNKNKKLLKGILQGCKIADCELIGGETAEMKNVYFRNGMDIAGFTTGFIETKDILPHNIVDGDFIFGLKSSGLHANGFSLINELFKNNDLHTSEWEELLIPTKIYVKEVKNILSKYKKYIKGICHITGGGFIKNIPRLLDDNLTFELLEYEIPELFKVIKEKSQLTWEEMFETFNCGIGLVIIFDKEFFGIINNSLYKNSTLDYLYEDFKLLHIGYIINGTKPILSVINKNMF